MLIIDLHSSPSCEDSAYLGVVFGLRFLYTLDRCFVPCSLCLSNCHHWYSDENGQWYTQIFRLVVGGYLRLTEFSLYYFVSSSI